MCGQSLSRCLRLMVMMMMVVVMVKLCEDVFTTVNDDQFVDAGLLLAVDDLMFRIDNLLIYWFIVIDVITILKMTMIKTFTAIQLTIIVARSRKRSVTTYATFLQWWWRQRCGLDILIFQYSNSHKLSNAISSFFQKCATLPTISVVLHRRCTSAKLVQTSVSEWVLTHIALVEWFCSWSLYLGSLTTIVGPSTRVRLKFSIAIVKDFESIGNWAKLIFSSTVQDTGRLKVKASRGWIQMAFLY